jgi:membrane fusion protein (multidrug efflux system)
MIMNTIISQTALAALALSLLYACSNPPQQAAASDQPHEYPVVAIARQQTVVHTDYPASLQGVQNIEIRPKVDGFVEQILVDEGATVKKGQLLFKIHAPQYEQETRTANAAIKSAEAEVNTARMQVEKVSPLVKEEIVSHYELEAAQFTLQTREAALAQAKASLVNARTNLGYTHIASPVDGVIGSLPHKTGSLVSSSSLQPLTTVSDISKVYAYFSFNEKQFLHFSDTYPGKTLEEKLRRLPPVTLILSNGKEYGEKGRVTSVNGLINPETGSVNFRATFPNTLGLIRSGGSANIRIARNVDSAILVPQKATYEIQGKRFVYKVDGGNTVKSTEIAVMEASHSGEYFIVERGLEAGDRIVAAGAGSLKDGTKIKPSTLSNK